MASLEAIVLTACRDRIIPGAVLLTSDKSGRQPHEQAMIGLSKEVTGDRIVRVQKSVWRVVTERQCI